MWVARQVILDCVGAAGEYGDGAQAACDGIDGGGGGAQRQHWWDDGGAQAPAKLPTTGDERYAHSGATVALAG
jgi:hypothetical protein